MSFTIKKLDLVYNWNLKQDEKICQLCQKHLIAPHGLDITKDYSKCKIIVGKCGHSFHDSCLNKTKTNVHSCPIDNTVWNIDYIFDCLPKVF